MHGAARAAPARRSSGPATARPPGRRPAPNPGRPAESPRLTQAAAHVADLVDATAQGEQQSPGLVRSRAAAGRARVPDPLAIDGSALHAPSINPSFRASPATSYHARPSRCDLEASQLDHLPVKALAGRAIVNLGNGSMLLATEPAAGFAPSLGGRGQWGARDREPCRARQSRSGQPARPGSISSAASRCSSSSSPICRSIPGTTGSQPASGRATPPRCSSSAPASPRRSPSAAASAGTASPSAACASPTAAGRSIGRISACS